MKKRQHKPAIKLNSTRQARGVQDVFRQKLAEIAQIADNSEHYCILLDELVSKTVDVSRRDKEVLSGVRTALNKEMFAMTGASGGVNYKSDYALLQTLKEDPQLGPALSRLEEQIIKLDDLLLRPSIPYVPENSEITLTTRKVPVKSGGKIIDYIYLETKDFPIWQSDRPQEVKEIENEPERSWPTPPAEIQKLLLERELLVNKAASYYLELEEQFGSGDLQEWVVDQGWEVTEYLPQAQAERFCQIEALLTAARLSRRP